MAEAMGERHSMRRSGIARLITSVAAGVHVGLVCRPIVRHEPMMPPFLRVMTIVASRGTGPVAPV